MDPISAVGLVASVVQLIDATAKVISYANDVRDAPRERAEFARHASSLLSLLIDLRYRVEESKSSSDSWFVSLRGLGADAGPLAQLKSQMERLAAKLERPNGRLEALRKALTWNLDKKEIEEVLEQIERVKTLVMLALQTDQL
jgi:DNA repair ATPase RecN